VAFLVKAFAPFAFHTGMLVFYFEKKKILANPDWIIKIIVFTLHASVLKSRSFYPDTLSSTT
jgi:hypothetical protein